MAASAPGLGGAAGPGPEAGDFLARYRQVSSKLKKRFLRKPNVAEAGEQFGQLGRELRAQECLPYAAWCQLAVARCQQALFHGPGEALALTEAARLFLRQERDARQRLACPAAYGEPLQAAANALGAAVRLHLELGQPAAAAALCLELAAALRDLGQPAAAAGHFQRAAHLQLPQLPLAALQALGDAASCQLLARDYNGALAVFTRMQRLAREHGSHPVPPPPPPPPPPPGPQVGPGAAPALPAALLPANGGPAPVPSPATLGAFSDVLVRCEVSRVLLLLLLQPPPAKLLPEHAHTLEKYSWEAFDGHGQESGGQLPDELFLLLQSLVMATHEKDTEAVKSLQVEMWPLLSAEQNHLLHLVLQENRLPLGTGHLRTHVNEGTRCLLPNVVRLPWRFGGKYKSWMPAKFYLGFSYSSGHCSNIVHWEVPVSQRLTSITEGGKNNQDNVIESEWKTGLSSQGCNIRMRTLLRRLGWLSPESDFRSGHDLAVSESETSPHHLGALR